MMQAKRIAELDILRGVAIVGVLVIHSSFQGRFTKETLALQAALMRLFDWAVAAFFFSSGWLHDSSPPLAVVLKKRALSLLVPFFLYNVFYNVCFAAVGAVGWVGAVSSAPAPYRLLTSPFISPGFQLYFLPYLFVIVIGVCALDKLNQRHQRWLRWGLLLAVLLFYLKRGYPEFSHGAALQHLPLYLAAFLIGLMTRPLIERRPAKACVLASALAVVLGVLVLLRSPVVSLTVPPLVVGLASTVPRLGASKPLLLLGAISGSIYLWHTPLLLPAFSSLLAHLRIPSLCNFFGSLIFTLGICLLLRRGVDEFFVRVLKRSAPRFITL